MAKLTIAILVFDDVEELDAIGPYQVFGSARALHPGSVSPVLVSKDGAMVQCVNGLRIQPDYSFETLPEPDVLLIPGGPGTRRAAQDDTLVEWVALKGKNSSWVASVCSGARITLASGLSVGRRITTHHGVIDELRARGDATVLDNVRFVRDGKLVHSAGISAGIDMSLWLLGQLFTPDVARETQDYMEYHPAPPYAYEI